MFALGPHLLLFSIPFCFSPAPRYWVTDSWPTSHPEEPVLTHLWRMLVVMVLKRQSGRQAKFCHKFEPLLGLNWCHKVIIPTSRENAWARTENPSCYSGFWLSKVLFKEDLSWFLTIHEGGGINTCISASHTSTQFSHIIALLLELQKLPSVGFWFFASFKIWSVCVVSHLLCNSDRCWTWYPPTPVF